MANKINKNSTTINIHKAKHMILIKHSEAVSKQRYPNYITYDENYSKLVHGVVS